MSLLTATQEQDRAAAILRYVQEAYVVPPPAERQQQMVAAASSISPSVVRALFCEYERSLKHGSAGLESSLFYQVPVLICHGELDPRVLMLHANISTRYFPRGEVRQYPVKGHCLFDEEERLSRDILLFLDRLFGDVPVWAHL